MEWRASDVPADPFEDEGGPSCVSSSSMSMALSSTARPISWPRWRRPLGPTAWTPPPRPRPRPSPSSACRCPWPWPASPPTTPTGERASRRGLQGWLRRPPQRRQRRGLSRSSRVPRGLEALKAEDHTFLAIATGKSAAGAGACLRPSRPPGQFLPLGLQVADVHPSKPPPLDGRGCLSGSPDVPTNRAVILADTTFRHRHGRCGHPPRLAFSWGYHPTTR